MPDTQHTHSVLDSVKFMEDDLFNHRNINDLIPEIIYCYLFQGLSLTTIEYKLFKTTIIMDG